MPVPEPGGRLEPFVEQALDDVVTALRGSFGDALVSVVLFGSAADGQLRATSDVNLIVVLRAFDRARVDAARDPLRLAHAAARVSAMFVLADELPLVTEAFAVKFADVGRRRRVLFGDDVFAGLEPTREAQIARLTQVLVNLALRLRSRYALVSLREEQLPFVIADAAGPLRAAAASILELEGRPAGSPKEALATLAREAGLDDRVMASVSDAREKRVLPPGVSAPVIFDLLALAGAMRERVARLAGDAA